MINNNLRNKKESCAMLSHFCVDFRFRSGKEKGKKVDSLLIDEKKSPHKED